MEMIYFVGKFKIHVVENDWKSLTTLIATFIRRIFGSLNNFVLFDIETLATFYWTFPANDVCTHWFMLHLFEGLEDGSRLHRINTSTTYISTRRKNQLASGKTLLTEVCYNILFVYMQHIEIEMKIFDFNAICLISPLFFRFYTDELFLRWNAISEMTQWRIGRYQRWRTNQFYETCIGEITK